MKRQARTQTLMKIFAATRGRKELERELQRFRKEFNKARAAYEQSSAQLAALQNQVESARQAMASSREGIMEITEILQTMDLTGANEARDRSDVKTYMVDGKEFYVEKNDANDIKMTPWKEYKKQQQDCGDVPLNIEPDDA